GIDPRYDAKGDTGRVPNRKALQLCGQVRRVLSTVLAGNVDEILRDLLVEEVKPAPNATRLLVVVSLTTLTGSVLRSEVLARRATAAGRLRCEVAAEIHRRQTPELMFQLRG